MDSQHTEQSGLFNAGLIRRYDRAGPRYTSYPTVVRFHGDFTENSYQSHGLYLFLLLLALLVSIFTPAPVTAEEIDWAGAINTAGRQRMLTQRIPRLFLQAGLGANAVAASEQLEHAIAEFDRQHAELAALDLPPGIRDALGRVGADWIRFRALARSRSSRETARRLVQLDSVLLEQCEHVVHLLEEQTATRQGRLVNLSGRQRMLSQRLVKNYMLLSAGLATPGETRRLDEDRAEFRKSLNTLISERNYSPLINVKLDEVTEQWIWVESALDSMAEDHYPIVVADAGEKILVLLERLVQLYADVEEGREPR